MTTHKAIREALPELPEPDRTMWQHGKQIDHYTADQMRAYALQAVEALTQALATTERKGEPDTVAVDHFDNAPSAESTDRIYPPVKIGTMLYASPQVPEGVQWLTVAEHGLPAVGEEVIGGHWYTDPWLKPECAARFVWCVCQVVADDHPDFPDGKRWHTFGPAYSHITHWARLNLPAIDAARKGE